MRVTSKGLTVWDQPTDPYSHTQLAANWDLIDSLIGSPATSMQTTATIPTTGNFAGRLVMLTASAGGFVPWTLIRFDGSAWQAVGPFEVQPAVPTIGNWPGRIVVLSTATGGFNAWDVIRYDGSSWNIIGGWTSINTGVNPTNIIGYQTAGDVFINVAARGLVLTDRANGTKRRIYLSGGQLYDEPVS